jgi:hypothetical protein
MESSGAAIQTTAASIQSEAPAFQAPTMASWLDGRLFHVEPGQGLMRGIGSEPYHAGPGLSHTDTKLLARSPFHYRNKRSDDPDVPPKMPSDGMRNGTAVHCATLEPETWRFRYATAMHHVTDKRSKAWREFVSDNPELEPLLVYEHKAIWRQADALRAHPRVAAELALPGDAEASAYWIDPETGVLCKCRPDRWCDHGPGVVLLDVKTTQDASAESFARAVHAFGYHTQAAWYCEGFEHATGRMVYGMVFAVVESEYPHAVAVYALDDAAIARGRARNRRALETFATCSRTGVWPGYSTEAEEIGLPYWSKD